MTSPVELRVADTVVPTGRSTEVQIRVVNNSDRVCTSIEVGLELPAGVHLVRGSPRIQLRRVQPGEHAPFTVTIRIDRPGPVLIPVPVLEYLDGWGQHHLERRHPPLRLVASGAGPEQEPPAKAALVLAGRRLRSGSWERLSGTIEHRSGPAIQMASLTLAGGPLTTDPTTARCDLGRILPAGNASFSIPVRADEPGSAVPVTFALVLLDSLGRRTRRTFRATIQVTGSDPVPPAPTPTTSKRTILFVAANNLVDPTDSAREIEEIGAVLDRSPDFEIITRQAVRANLLVKDLRRRRPEILHFSGHGSGTGFEARSGGLERIEAVGGDGRPAVIEEAGYLEMPVEALRTALDGRGVRLVVLNCCGSAGMAEEIARSARSVVATPDTLNDAAAIGFSRAFYDSLADGSTVGVAVRDGASAVGLERFVDRYECFGDPDQVLVGHPVPLRGGTRELR